jgi:hypothetical protein
MGSTATEVTRGESRPDGSSSAKRLSRETRRLLPVIAPVLFLASVVLVVATSAFAAFNPSPTELAGLVALMAAATFVEAFPVPIENVPVGGTSLATVFIVGAAIVYGWAPAIMVGFVSQVVVEIGRRQPPIRIAYNSAVYTLAAAGAGAVTAAIPSDGFAWLALEVGLAASAFYAVNLPLVAAKPSRRRSSPSPSWPRSR